MVGEGAHRPRVARLLLRIGTGRVWFGACPPGDAAVSCRMQSIETQPGDVAGRELSVRKLLRRVLQSRATVFEHRGYEHFLAGPQIPLVH